MKLYIDLLSFYDWDNENFYYFKLQSEATLSSADINESYSQMSSMMSNEQNQSSSSDQFHFGNEEVADHELTLNERLAG